MPTRRFEQVDTSTGEVTGSFVAVVQPKRSNGFSSGWFAMSQEAIANLRVHGLTGRDYEVLMMLLSQLDYENLIQVNQTALAKEIGMRQPHVARTIKKLVSIGAIIEGPKIGASKTYRLDPNLGWKGTAKNHHNALKERMRAAGMSLITRDQDTVDFINGKADKDS